MRSLYLLRHAKSSWDDPALTDFDRPVAPRGRRAAPAVGAYMRRHGLVPDLALCSSARRARETFALVAAELDGDVPVQFLKELYTAQSSDLLHQIRQAPDTARRLLLIGHNPTIEQLAAMLAGDGDEDALRRLQKKYPTAGLTVFSVEAAQWADLTEMTSRLERFVTPADLA